MKSLLILLSTFLSLALVSCKEGTIVYDVEFPRADSDEVFPYFWINICDRRRFNRFTDTLSGV